MSRHDRSKTTMKDLIAEAERKQIGGAEWMDRASLMRALDEAEGVRGSGTLARARRFFGQVTGLDRVVKVVRGAIDPTRPEPVSLVTSESDSESKSDSESVTRSLLAAPEPVIEIVNEVDHATLPGIPATADLLACDPAFDGMRVVNRAGNRWLVWRASTTRLAALGRGDDLTLRLVSVDCAIGTPDAQVVVQTADEPGLALEGMRALPEIGAHPCVAAIGVGRGDGFVAIAHARVA